MFCADSSAARWPYTTTVAGSDCASAAPLAIRASCAAPMAIAVFLMFFTFSLRVVLGGTGPAMA